MIGVSVRPSSSSAARIVPTRPSIMSLGAMMSAPARAWETAVRASSSSVASLSTPPSDAEHAAVAVAGVLAQAQVSDHQQLRVGLLDRPGGQLHDTLVIPRARALLVLGGREPEQQHGGDPERRGLAGLGDGMGDRQPVDAGHRRDRLAAIDAVGDEHRVDEVGRGEARLPHEAAERAAGPEPAQAGLRERHSC